VHVRFIGASLACVKAIRGAPERSHRIASGTFIQDGRSTVTTEQSDGAIDPRPGRGRGRFAPSTTGRAHPGTLLAALLCWLDARSRGAEVVLRLEDLDRERTRPDYVTRMEADLAWLGLDWDARRCQSEARSEHESVVDALVASGEVYACACSRSRIRATGRRAPDGSFAYDGSCRANVVDRASWRDDPRPLRLRLESGTVRWLDEAVGAQQGDAAAVFGDPLIRRRDGAFGYHFVSVVDDAREGVERVVRGRDLAPATLVQVALQRRLALKTPVYHHHCLLLERRGEKLSKLHGAVDVVALREQMSAETLCGLLAGFVGLVGPGERCRPADLVDGFDWARVSREDVLLRWDAETGLSRVAEDGTA
jgi:glutamyl-tRNA synthetase/glutamyl-Q tRNA(Asp) synthetase